jgi:hypothetical protein
MANAFSDEALRQVVRKNEKGVIFSWSPHMPLSIKAYFDLQTAAGRLGLKVFPVLDADADPVSSIEVVKKHQIETSALRRMQSIELYQRGMAIHFPSILVFSGGKIRGDIIPGAKQEDLYETLIKRELAQN